MRAESVLEWTLLGLSVGASALSLAVLVIAAAAVRAREEKAAHVCIFSMTLANLLLTLVHYPARAVAKHTALFTQPVECLSVYSVLWVAIPASAFSLTLLNLEKIAYFAWPLHYHSVVSKWKAVVAVAVAWALCVGNVVWGLAAREIFVVEPSVQLAHQFVPFFCNHIRINTRWYTVYAAVFTLFPVASSLGLSLYLLGLSHRFRAPASPDGGQRRKSLCGLRPKSVVFIFATTLWTAIALLPARIYFLANLRHDAFAELVTTYLLFLDPIVNPLITLTVNPMYLKAFRDAAARCHAALFPDLPAKAQPRKDSGTLSSSAGRSRGGSSPPDSPDVLQPTAQAPLLPRETDF